LQHLKPRSPKTDELPLMTPFTSDLQGQKLIRTLILPRLMAFYVIILWNFCKVVHRDGECFIVVWRSTSLEDLVDATFWIPFQIRIRLILYKLPRQHSQKVLTVENAYYLNLSLFRRIIPRPTGGSSHRSHSCNSRV